MLSSPGMFDAPQDATSSALAGDYVQPTLNHALRVWWAFYWRTSLIAGVLSFLISICIRLLYENTAVSAALIGWTEKISPYALFYFIAIFVFRSILHKKFRHFRLALAAQSSPDAAQALQPTVNRALLVWWAYSWRTVIFSAIAGVVVSYPMGLTLGLFAPSPLVLQLFSTGLGMAVGAAVGLYVIYSNILDEDIGDFHVSLLPIEKVAAAQIDALPTTAAS